MVIPPIRVMPTPKDVKSNEDPLWKVAKDRFWTFSHWGMVFAVVVPLFSILAASYQIMNNRVDARVDKIIGPYQRVLSIINDSLTGNYYAVTYRFAELLDLCSSASVESSEREEYIACVGEDNFNSSVEPFSICRKQC